MARYLSGVAIGMAIPPGLEASGEAAFLPGARRDSNPRRGVAPGSTETLKDPVLARQQRPIGRASSSGDRDIPEPEGVLWHDRRLNGQRPAWRWERWLEGPLW